MALIKKYNKYLKTTALIWGVFLIAFALVYYFVIYPSYEARKKAEKQLAESREEYEHALKVNQEDTKARMIEELQVLQNKLDVFALDFKSAADLTFDISRIAGESKVSSFNIQSDSIKSASADPNNIFEKHIKVSFAGGFRELAEFINNLERHQPVLFINDFKLSRQEKDKSSYQVALDIAALIRKPQVAKTNDGNAEKIVSAKF